MADLSLYEQLADALDALPNGFPRTKSGVEIRLLQKIFSEEEARLTLHLNGTYEPIDNITERLNRPVKELRSELMQMVKRGLLWFKKENGKPHFRMAPFVVGFFEAHLEEMDHEFAHLVENYLLDGGSALMGMQPALHRAVPAISLSQKEWILPYDNVHAMITNAKGFYVRDCICRKQKEFIGERCNYPMEICLTIYDREIKPGPGIIDRQQAIALLDQAEEAGLVHSVSNVKDGVDYICNCCGCCCAVLRGVTEFGYENSVAHANYTAIIDTDTCDMCENCLDRCQVDAIIVKTTEMRVDPERCIGCGLCITGCPSGAAILKLKPDDQIVEPPANFAVWDSERLKNRGLAK